MRCRHLYGIFHPFHCTLECVSWSFFLWRIILRKRRGNPAGGNAVMVSFHVSLVSIQPLVLLVVPPPPSQPGAAYVPLQTKNLWRASHSQLSIPRRTFPVVPRAPSSIKQHCTLGLSSFRWYKLHLPPRSCIGWSWGCLFCGTWLVIRISRPGLAREYLIYYRGPGCLAVVWYDLFPLSPISKLSLFISLPVCRRLSLLTQNRFKIIRTGSKSQRNKTHGALLCAVFKLNSAFAANSILKCHLASLNISFAQ
jgi:hypothetical protein